MRYDSPWFPIVLALAKRFGRTNKKYYRRIYAAADWHSWNDRNGKVEVKKRIVILCSDVRAIVTHSFFGWQVYLNDEHASGDLQIHFSEGQLPENELTGAIVEFLAGANQEKLPLGGETPREEMFPELMRRTVAFLTRESNVFHWGGWTTYAPSKDPRGILVA